MTDKELMQQALDALNLEMPFGAYLKLRNALRDRLVQPEQDPVAWANSNDLQNFDMKVRTNGGPLHTVPLYTTPPQRPWVGLTDEEIHDAFQNSTRRSIYEVIEFKLKEKNT